MRIGIDIDGVLADFNEAYVALTIKETGRDLFPGPYGTFDITCWNYPESYGYTAEEMKRVWALIKKDTRFWYNLNHYPTVTDVFRDALLDVLEDAGCDVYFITQRVGVTAKAQTEAWLWNHLGLDECPTVLISADKGLLAKALDLDVYIDDKVENVEDVLDRNPRTQVFRMVRTWGRPIDGATDITSLEEFAQVFPTMPTIVQPEPTDADIERALNSLVADGVVEGEIITDRDPGDETAAQVMATIAGPSL